MKKMKLYIISGLGADFKILEHLKFPAYLEPVFLDWLIPEKNETLDHYVLRMAKKIDASEPFCLLGYSFGGIIVQEIHRIFPAEKVVILGSIRSHKEKAGLLRAAARTGIAGYLPLKLFTSTFTENQLIAKMFDSSNAKLMEYFTVRDPYYLKWGIAQISAWKSEESPEVIQILGDRDQIFPIAACHPDYVIKGGTHLFPATRHREVSAVLEKIFNS